MIRKPLQFAENTHEHLTICVFCLWQSYGLVYTSFLKLMITWVLRRYIPSVNPLFGLYFSFCSWLIDPKLVV